MIIKSQNDIEDLSIDYSNIELFGPKTPNPYLVLNLDSQISKKAESFLARLPCPVISIGALIPKGCCDIILTDTSKLTKLRKNIAAAPFASMILVQHLRASVSQKTPDALVAESLAYGVLQNGPEFKNWLSKRSPVKTKPNTSSPLSIDTRNDIFYITLTQPENKNAITAALRDALCEALDIGIVDRRLKKITVTGSGSTFSTGGDIREFGTISDPATAHSIRTLRLPAHRLATLSERLEFHINGVAIGAGIEMAAFGRHITATARAWFQLPELKYGLIPGAGGTVSIPKRIGRHKTAYMALSMDRIRAPLALEWGLIDAIVDAPDDI